MATERIPIGKVKGFGAEAWLAPIAPADVPCLAETIAGMEPWSCYPYPPDRVAAYLAKDEPGTTRLSILLGDEVSGVVGLRLNWLRGPYVQMLAILPGFQGQGIGAMVLDWLEVDARARYEKNLWVCASDFNTSALRFYERHGFRRVASLEGLVTGDHTEILMRYPLK